MRLVQVYIAIVPEIHRDHIWFNMTACKCEAEIPSRWDDLMLDMCYDRISEGAICDGGDSLPHSTSADPLHACP